MSSPDLVPDLYIIAIVTLNSGLLNPRIFASGTV